MLPLEEVKLEQELKQQRLEAIPHIEVEGLISKQWSVLLEVDDTLVMSNKKKEKYDSGYYYHQPLVAALKQIGLTEVYLFTAYKLSSVSRTAENEVIGNPSRLKLKNYLATQGIQVKGVLTPLDVVYNQGIGAYYEQVILPFEEQVLKGESLLEGPQKEAYDKAFKEELELIKTASQNNINLGDKGSAFSYLKAQLEPLGPDAFLFFDHQSEYLRQIEQLNKGETPLFTFRVWHKDTEKTYQQALEPFLEYTPRWQTLKKRILRSYQVTATPLVFNKLMKALEEALPISTLPLVFQAKLASIELQFESFVKNPCLTLSPPHPLSAEALEKAIRKLASEQETGYQLWGYGEAPLYLSPEMTHRLLLKGNLHGNSDVSCVENSDKEKIFFKKPKQNALQPLIEAFIFELNRCLGGGCVAPTRLLVLQKPNQERVLLQASLGVGEIDLEPLLMIPGGIQSLEKLLGKEQLLKALPEFLDGSYFEEWLAKQGPKLDLNSDEERTYFLKVFLGVFTERQDNWPIDFKEQYQKHSKSKDDTIDEGALNQALGEWGPTPWLKVLALITQYPVLLKEGSLTNLSQLPDLFEALDKVYAKVDAKVNAEAILQHAAKLLDYFSKRNYSQHFLLSLLTGPNDDKGENFRVAIFRDNQGFPTDLQLIAIDVNMAFRQGFICGRPQVNTVVYALRQLLERSLENSIKTLLSQTSPSTVLLKVFSKVLILEKYYKQLLEQVYPEAAAKSKDFNLDLTLGDFFKKHFEKKWKTLVFKLFQPFPSMPTHAELFAKHEPGLSCYYQALAERVKFDPQAIIIVLFNLGTDPQYDIGVLSPIKAKKEAHLFSPLPKASSEGSLEKLLDAQLQSSAKPEVLSLEVMMQLNILPKSALSLSVDVFTVLFASHRERFIAWLNHLRSKVAISISVSEELIASLSEPTSWPWKKVLPFKNPWLVEGLSMLGFEVNKKGEAGYTPLQEAVCLNLPQMLLPLIESGADKSVLLEDRTLLFLALERQAKGSRESYEAILETLVALSIPYDSEDFALGLKCAEDFSGRKKFDYQAALFLDNPELAWAFSLQAISQSEEPKENPIILQGLGSHCYLKPAVHQQITEEGILLKTNEYGRHRVTSVPILLPRCQLGIHFKEKPEFIGREVQGHTLSQILFPGQSLTPQTAILKFAENKAYLPWSRVERGYPVLATATVFGGITLQDVLDDPQELEKIDAVSFSQALLFTLLINPEDGRGDNYLLCPQYHKTGYQYKLIPIDHERSLVRPLELNVDGSSVSGPKGLNVKSILYCLNQMQKPLSAKVIEAFLEHRPFETLQKWLKIIGEKQGEIDHLFSKEREALKRAKINLQMVFEPSVIAELYEKFQRIQHVLREDPYCSGLTLLCKVMPALGYRYQDTFHDFKTPKERFDFLTEGCFVVANLEKEVILPSGRTQTKTISKTTSSARDIVQLTAAVREKKSLMEAVFAKKALTTPDEASKYLKTVHTQSLRLEQIQQEVCQGEFKRFLGLLTSHQQAILNGEGPLKPFDFPSMKKGNGETDIERQEQLLSLLGKLSFTALRIYHCEALKESSLRRLLQGSRETLSALELNTCENLSIAVLLTINLNCPRLEKLGLVNLSFSGGIKLENNCFKVLRVLRIENCLGITQCYLNAPQLERLHLINLNLKQINTKSQSLHTIELEHCKFFPEKALYELGIAYSKLKKVKLTDCPLFTNTFYYEKYPSFLNAFIKEGDEQVLNKMFSRLHEALQWRSFVAEKLNQTEAFAQTVHLILAPPLTAGLQVQAFLDGCLESKDIYERLFAVWLLVSSRFQLLSMLPQEVRIKRVLNNLLELARDHRYPIGKTALMLLCEVLSQDIPQLSREERQALWKTLLEVAKDETSWWMRETATEALGQIVSEDFSQLSGEERQALLRPLLEATELEATENWNVWNIRQVRKAALKALGQGISQSFFQLSGEERQALLKLLLKTAKDKDSSIKRAAIEALGQGISQSFFQLSGEERQALLKLLLKVAKDEDSFVKEAAIEALGQGISQSFFQLSGEEWQALLQPLLKVAETAKDGYSSQRGALKALGQVVSKNFSQLSGEERQALLKFLLEMAKDKNWRVREVTKAAAMEALGQVVSENFSQLSGEERRALLKFLLEMAEDWHVQKVRGATLKALGQVVSKNFSQLSGEERQVLLKALLKAAKDAASWTKDAPSFIRETAIEALGQVVSKNFSQLSGEERRALLKPLLEVFESFEVMKVKMAASKALGQVVSENFSQLSGEERQALLKALLKAAKNKNWLVMQEEKAAAMEALGQVVSEGFSQLSGEERQALLKPLLEAAKDKDWQVSKVRHTALKALGQVVSESFSQLSGEERQVLLKLLLELAKDEKSWIRETSTEALGQVISQGFFQLSRKEQLALLKTLLEVNLLHTLLNTDLFLSDRKPLATLGKVLGNEQLVEYLSCATLPQQFIQALETHSEIRGMLNQETDALVEALQDYTPYEIEKLLSTFRNQLFVSQRETEKSDSPYHQNSKSCFLANPLLVNQDLRKQFFEITHLLLTQEPPWYPKRMILPLLEQACWSVLVLDCDYEKLSFDLLLDNPANSNLDRVLSTVKSSLDRLVQSYYGSFRIYSFPSSLHHKFFAQLGVSQSAHTGPLILKNIEAYLSRLDQPLKQFAKMDSLAALEYDPRDPLFETFHQVQQLVRKGLISKYTSLSGELAQHIEDYSRDPNEFLTQSLQAIRLKHRTLLVDAPDRQLGFRGLFFKYTRQYTPEGLGFPPSVESLVTAYCGIEDNFVPSGLLLQSSGMEGFGELNLSDSLSTIKKPTVLETKTRSEQRVLETIDVSRQGNNCGLFALTLGVKLASLNNPGGKAKVPDFIKDIANKDLQKETKKTEEIGKNLRMELVEALSKDKVFQEGRYQNFVQLAVSYLDDQQTERDMEAFLRANKDFLEKIKGEWQKLKPLVSQRTPEAFLPEFEGPINKELVEKWVKKVKETLKELTEENLEKRVRELLEALSGSNTSLISFKKVYQLVWREVTQTDASPTIRQKFNSVFEKFFEEKLIGYLSDKMELGKLTDELFKLALLKRVSFEQNGKVTKLPIIQDIIEEAVSLFSELSVSVREWQNIYGNYLSYIRDTDVFLSADELGSLASCWEVQLKIQFREGRPYTTYQEFNPKLLHVTLCNPSRIHWNVVSTGEVTKGHEKLMDVINKIQNVELKQRILEAVKNKEAYDRRVEDCSYLIRVLSVIQGVSAIFQKQGTPLGENDIQLIKELSVLLEEEGVLKVSAETIYKLREPLEHLLMEPAVLATVGSPSLPLVSSPPLVSGSSSATGTDIQEEPTPSTAGAVHTRGLFEAIKAHDVEKVKASIKKLNLQAQNIQDPGSGKTLAEILLNSAVKEEIRIAVDQAITENLEKEKACSEESQTFTSLFSQPQYQPQISRTSVTEIEGGKSVSSLSVQGSPSLEDWNEDGDKADDKVWEEVEEERSFQEMPAQSSKGKTVVKQKQAAGLKGMEQIEQGIPSPLITFSFTNNSPSLVSSSTSSVSLNPSNPNHCSKP